MLRFAASISEFSSNTGKYRLGKTSYLHTTLAVYVLSGKRSFTFTFFTSTFSLNYETSIRNFYSTYLVKISFCVCRVSIFVCHMTRFFIETPVFSYFLTLICFLEVFFMFLMIQRLLKYDFLIFSHYFSYFIACVCLSDCNGNRTHNHLVCKRTLNHLCKQAK